MREILGRALCASLASCGTILNGGPFMVPVSSNPPGATVYYGSFAVGKTPCTVPMYAKDTQLRFALDGCHSETVDVPTSMNWWGALGNGCFLLPGIIIGCAVDFSTGCHRVVDTEQVTAHLLKSNR